MAVCVKKQKTVFIHWTKEGEKAQHRTGKTQWGNKRTAAQFKDSYMLLLISLFLGTLTRLKKNVDTETYH